MPGRCCCEVDGDQAGDACGATVWTGGRGEGEAEDIGLATLRRGPYGCAASLALVAATIKTH